jgi:hemolysin type calcium-binding protein
LVAALVVMATPVDTAGAFIGPYTGVGRGALDRQRHIDNHAPDPADHIVTDSSDVYRGRFTYSFRIDEFGTIRGRGDGSYQQGTYHLEGVNGSHGAFSCDLQMTTTDFTVRVTGQTSDGDMHVRFALEDARESNEETLCGADYSVFATDDTRLANSLELVQPADGLEVSQARPRTTDLRKLEDLGDDFDHRVNLHEWEITMRAPDALPPPVDPGVGAYGTPGAAGRRARVCTIEGTRGRDRLRGTPGNDVICAFGGRDTINGLGGADIVFGGPGADKITGGRGKDALYGNAGRDRFAARDGKRDRVTGGAGRDRARVDSGRDRVRQVELLG